MSPPRKAGAAGRRTALTGEDFEALLTHLAPDREQAGERYEDIRRRLVRLFEWRQCEAPEDLADEAISRVARRLAEGTEIRSTSPFAYFCGVAHHVSQEMLRERERERRAFTDAGRAAAASQPEPPEPATERRLACLHACLGRLSAGERRLILQYHQGDDRVEGRRRLAHELGIALNALRIRAHRVRRKLAGCCLRCLAAPEPERRPERQPERPDTER
jgi:DNA-directed RNA polymerase specialized sigma24 family protein